MTGSGLSWQACFEGGGLSLLTGNDTLGAGIDLRSDSFPRLVSTTCGRSERGETGESFGVCQND